MSQPTIASRGPIGDLIAFTVDEVSADLMRARWQVTPVVHQPAGLLHGGVHAWVHETMASVPAGLWLGDRGQVVGVNNSSDFYRAVREGELTSIASPVHRGRTQQVWVVQTEDATGRLIARGQVRLQNLATRPD